MGKLSSYLFLLGIIFLTPSLVWSWSDSSKKILEDLLIAEGINKAQAQKITHDSRLSVRPDFIVKNLFYSSPRGTAQKPDVMEISPRQITRGKAFMKRHSASLSAVEKSFGTSSRIITAILLIESRLATCPMPFNAVNAYVNIALLQNPVYLQEVQALYAKTYPQINDVKTVARAQSKSRWAVYELANLIHLANGLGMDPLTISGSFSGALGPAQFLPSSFRLYGIDGDGDGIASPFNLTDAKFSIGHYLRIFGWAEDAPLDQKRKAVWFYNHSSVYVNTVMLIYDELGR